jgi:hypothetical protein
MYSPPALLHLAVGTHTPGAPFLPVQGPFSSERRTPAKGVLAVERAVKERRRRGRVVSCILGFKIWSICQVWDMIDEMDEEDELKVVGWASYVLHLHSALIQFSTNGYSTRALYTHQPQ